MTVILYVAGYLVIATGLGYWIGGRLRKLSPDPMQEPWGDYPHQD